MSDMQKIADTDLGNFLKQEDLSKLAGDQKYQLFKKLELPIQYAVNKAVKKFHSLPLEENDFTAIAWMAFEEVLKKYKKNLTKKSFISYLIDAVYWKSLDYACSFINNHHRILNITSQESRWIENPRTDDDLGHRLTVKIIVEDYFHEVPDRELVVRVFNDYLYESSVHEISDKYQITRNQVRRILSKTIRDLSKLLA